MIWTTQEINVDERRISLSVADNDSSVKTLIIGPAIGVKSSFYRILGEYFYKQGFNCVLLDYHGMFFEGHKPSVSDIASFGKIDLKRVIEYTSQLFANTDLFFLGHSISGQVLPLAINANRLRAAYLVASQSVDVTQWTGKSRYAVNVFWNVLVPLSTSVFNYLPSWTYGGKHHLSKSVARDWARLAKTVGGVAHDTRVNRASYNLFNVPTKFVSIDGDDMLAPRKAVQALHDNYGSATKELLHVTKQNASDHLDHFSFFKQRNAHLWTDILDWYNKHSRDVAVSKNSVADLLTK